MIQKDKAPFALASSMGSKLWVIGLLAALFLLGGAAPQHADAAFGIKEFEVLAKDADGVAVFEAGAHPYETTTKIRFNESQEASGQAVPDGQVKNQYFDLPPGIVGYPTVLAQCTEGELETSGCPAASQVGYVTLPTALQGTITAGVFNMQPPGDVPAAFGFNIGGIVVSHLLVSVRTASDYGIRITVPNATQSPLLLGSTLTLWGVPSDESHTPYRGSGFLCFGGEEPTNPATTTCFGGGESVSGKVEPFMSNPTYCSGHPEIWTMSADSWQAPGALVSRSFTMQNELAEPSAFFGCDRLSFDPQIRVRPVEPTAGANTGYSIQVSMPYAESPEGKAAAALRKAVIALPRGTSLSASSVNGLSSCTTDQIDLSSVRSPGCPASSKVGDVTLDTPLLKTPLTGSVYLAQPSSGQLLKIYVVAEGAGVVVKLPARIEADPQTGQLTATVTDSPQLPFRTLTVRLFGGAIAPLRNPQNCGPAETIGTFTAWSGAVRVVRDTFRVSPKPGGGCGNAGFAPELEAGTTNPLASAYSDFAMRVSRESASPELGQLSVKLPKGLLGKLAGISYCPESALASISQAEGAAGLQMSSPSCPAGSQVGTITAGAGAGALPFYLETGRVYLAGPYKGAPLSLAVVSPVLAGPFDLGNVLVRTALEVDRTTAQITAVSDPLPTILHGIPLDLRDLRIDVNRPEFILNPTNCAKQRVTSTITSTAGQTATPSSHFQVADCERLAFKPHLALKLSGKTHRAAYPKLRATLTMPKGGANIARAAVMLPRTEILAQEHIKTICTRPQYAAKTCPVQSVYGYAKAWSPLLDKPLEGPVYLRSSSNPLPDLVASLDGQIHVDLQGRIDSKNARIRNTFDLVPDAPISKFVLTMQGGKKGLLVNKTELCKAKPRATALFDAQNGKSAELNPRAKVDCGKKDKRK